MTIKRTITTITAFLAASMAAFMAMSAGAAVAAQEPPDCQTTPWRSEFVQQAKPGHWGYSYRIVWCVEQGSITWAEQEIIAMLPDDSDCVWQGTVEGDLRKEDSGSWRGFDMSRFSCPETNDYPWGIILVHPDGTSEIPGQGTA